MASTSETRPNILLLLSDQERYDVSSPNGPDVDTERMDEFQSEGMRFDRAYTPTSICTSARASLLSGKYPHNHGMINNCHEPDAILEDLPDELTTFGELLQRSGYRNSYIGKWHVGRNAVPEDFGFEYLGGGDGHHGDVDTDFREYQRELGVDPDDVPLEDEIYTEYDDDPLLISATADIPVEAMRTYYITEKTIERIEQAQEFDAPFFHRMDFWGPHHPYVVPEPYASMYDPGEVELWENFVDPLDGKPAAHREFLKYRGVENVDEETWREIIAKYFGFVTFIDDQLGRVMDALDRTGLADDTVVVHAADHGDFTGSHRQFNKGPLMYEETYHIPLMVRWPGVVEPGTACDEFVLLHDLMPTFLELGGLSPPDDIDTRSLVPLLEGESPEDWRDSVFAEYSGEEFGLYSQRMVRTDRYKFVYNGPDRDELYDLERDPHELLNLVDHQTYQDVRTRLESKLVEWMEETDDSIRMWPAKVLGE